MITEQQEQDNPQGFQLLSIANSYEEPEDRRTESLPDRSEVRTESLPARTGRGFSNDEIEAIERGIDDVYEGKAQEQTTDKPRLVTRGHHSLRTTPPTQQKHTTKHDWLTFTAREPYWVFQELLELACPGVNFIKRKTGKNGYHSGFNVMKDKKEIATICYGSKHNEGQNKKAQLIITGGGCTDYFDFSIIYHYALLMEKPTITVIHVAYDDFEGVNTIESIIKEHEDLKFMSKKSSKNPKITPHGIIQPDGTNPGRSVYIGSTKSSMQLCNYEKGYESFKAILNSEDPKDATSKLLIENMLKSGEKSKWSGLTKPSTGTSIEELEQDVYDNDGKAFDLAKWLRLELRFRNSNRDIPLDILIYPDKYFSGAYPFTEELMKMSDSKKTVLFKTQDQLDLMVRIQNMKAIAGSLIEDLLCLGWSNYDIVEALKGGKGASQKLIRSGAYKDC